MKIGVISVTNQGDLIANKLKSYLDVKVFSKNNIEDFSIRDITRELMESYEGLIFIASTGIAVRSIAPFLKGKDVDPAVLVIDTCANFVISLVSGHLGGANELTLKVASILKAQPVITTATDNLNITAPDIIAKENNLVIEDLKKAKRIAAKLVEGKKIGFIDDKGEIPLPKGYVEFKSYIEKADKNNTNNKYSTANGMTSELDGLVYVTNKCESDFLKNDVESLKLIRKDIVLGIGCRKNFDTEKMRKIVFGVLKEKNIDVRAVTKIATVEIKKEESAIQNLSKILNAEMKVFTLDEIKKIEDKYKGSDFVKRTIGVRAVCEPCVELSKGRLLTDKMACDGMTICIGELETVVNKNR